MLFLCGKWPIVKTPATAHVEKMMEDMCAARHGSKILHFSCWILHFAFSTSLIKSANLPEVEWQGLGEQLGSVLGDDPPFTAV